MLRRLLIAWACNAAALLVAATLLSGIGYGHRWWTLVVAAAVFTLVNALVRPVVRLLSLPLIVVTLGLFLLVINVGMLYLTAALVPDFHIDSFWSGLAAAIVVTLVNALLHPLRRGAGRRR
jgi:putative membrane protein